MRPRLIGAVLGVVLGGWMIFDGIHVIRSGKYFGPEKPGPWAGLVAAAGVDPFRLGLPFILLGGAWLAAVALLVTAHPWAWWLGVAVAVGTLWYLPVGTALAIAYLALLVVYRKVL